MEGPRSPAGSITPSASKSRPASPSLASQEPGEHADSPLRKRPRLDCGVELDEAAAMLLERGQMDMPSTSSPDRTVAASDSSLPSPQHQPQQEQPRSPGAPNLQRHPLTPSKVTLNLRSTERSPTRNPPNGPYPTSNKTLQDLPDPFSSSSSGPARSIEPMQVVVDAPSPSDRSPVVEIITEPEIDLYASMISDDEVPLENRLIDNFPFAVDFGAAEAALMIAEAVAKHSPEVDHLDAVSMWIDQTWLKNVQNVDRGFENPYTDSQDFWLNLATIYWKFLNRKTQFGNLGRSGSAEHVMRGLEQFFEPYTRLCAHIVLVDISILHDHTLKLDDLPDLVSSRHIRNLGTLFRVWNQTPLFKVLWEPFRLPAEHMQRKLAINLLSSDPDGLVQIVEFANGVTSSVQMAAKFWNDVDFSVCAVRYISLYLKDFWLSHASDDLQVQYSAFIRACLDLVSNLQRILLELPLKQNGFGPELSFRLLDFACYILQDAMEVDNSAAWSLVQQEFGDLKNMTAREAARLVQSCLHLQICWKFVAKGRMELRVSGVQNLSTNLVGIWRDFSPIGAKPAYPPFHIVAQWIVNQKIVEYLVSVDSHPQLIVRSQDVAGFVLVTHHWTPDLTDAVWDAVDSNPDPRMIAEILEMLSKIVHLAEKPVVSAFCDKLEALQTISLTTAMHHFLEKLKLPLIEMLRAKNRQSDLDIRKPLLLFIRVICDAAIQLSIQSSGGFAIINSLHSMALGALKDLSVIADDYDGRKEIYADCFEEVRKRSQRSVGCLEAILALLDAHQEHDLPFLMSGMDLPRRLSEDICSFINEAKRDTPERSWLVALGPRLKLLTKLLSSGSTESLPTEIQEQLWNHLVGSDAFNDASRDHAWSFLVSIMRVCNVSDPLMDRCIHDFILKLPPSLFTAGMFDFVQESIQYVQRINPPPPLAEEQAISIPLADLLWRIILQAPENTIEHAAAILLSQYHLDTPLIQKAPPSSIAATHTALMKRCIIQLKHASGRSPQLCSSEFNGECQDRMTFVPFGGFSEELCFKRTLHFMRRFIHEVRARPAFRNTEALPPSPASDVATSNDIQGELVEILYQAFEGGSHKEVKEIKIGSLATVAELADRLRKKTGFVQFRAFHSGALFDVVKNANETVESIHGKGLLIIQNSGVRKNSFVTGPNFPHCTSVAERALLNHFDTLYELLNLDQNLSSGLCEFLLTFPPHNRVRDLVLSSDPQLNELFPRGNRIKVVYSLRCIRELLCQQLAGGADSETFTLKGVQVLSTALTESYLAPAASSPNFDEEVLALLVDCLLIFLKQRPLENPISGCIVNKATFADELFVLLEYAMAPPSSPPLFDCCKVYACLLEASFHSAEICQAFINQQNPEKLHRWLLLENPNSIQRQEIRISIESMCTNAGTISAGPSHEIVPFFWQILASLIPQSASRPFRCQELLATAKTLFPDQYALCHDEASLHGLLLTWTNILSTYQHYEESPQGRRDGFVLGISKLLSSCVSFLRSFKKPINGHRLMEILFQRYLFPPVAREFADDQEISRASGLPILCTETRREMYNLVLALCENPVRSDWLLQESSKLLQTEEKEPSGWNQDINRWMRTSTGYSGLRNLTNTCYMNSLMAQLFMNSKFRNFLLSVPVSAGRGPQKLLFETQRLLAYMQNSTNKYAETWSFAESIQPYDAEHIDVSVQMDVDEFYNLLFDRWECQMPSPEIKQEFRALYGGQLVTQIKSKDCEHVSETTEPFMAIQCEVRGKGNLGESLQAYVEGDAMEGDNKYKCESCGGRFVNAVKRSCVKNLPDNLIFHLKRFDFDLSTLDRHKINDEFGFPEQIDMRQFCVDYLNDPTSTPDRDLFELVGVLVHNGTAESGHYYSYIRMPSASMTFGTSTWAEFNDIEVSEFDPGNIPDQCFGGTTVDDEMIFPKHHSAYMLFYRRLSAIKADAEAIRGVQRKGPNRFPTRPDLEAEIVRENQNLARRFCLFEPAHAHFLRSLVSRMRDWNRGACSSGHESEDRVCRMLVHHSSLVLSRVRDVPELEPTISILLKIVTSCGECANSTLSFLAQHTNVTQDVLVFCASSKARNIWGRLVVTMLQSVKKMDPQAYGIEAESKEFDVANIFDTEDGTILDHNYENGTFLRTMHCLEAMIPHLGKFIRSWDDYFSLWAEIINLGITELGALLSHGLLNDFLGLLELADNKRLTNTKFQATHECILRHKRSAPRTGLIKAIRSFFVHVNPCSYLDDINSPAARLESFVPAIQRFPVNDSEYEMIHQVNTKGQLAFLNRILDGWDAWDGENCAPADIVGELVRCCLSDAHCHDGHQTIRRIGESLASILSEYHTLYSRTILSACLTFCRVCPNIQDALQILEEAYASVGLMKDQKRDPQRNSHGAFIDYGPQGGAHYVDFFRSLYEMTDADCSLVKGESPYKYYIIDRATTWAAPLLLFDQKPVRSATVLLLEQLIFNNYPYHLAENPITDETEVDQLDALRILANRNVFESCGQSISRAGQLRLPSSFVQATAAVMTQCASFSDKLSREDSKILGLLQMRLDRYHNQKDMGTSPSLADSSSKLVQRWSEYEAKLRDWAYDSEIDEAISDTEWGSSFDDLSDAVTDT